MSTNAQTAQPGQTGVLAGLQPTALWQHFEALTRIPRPSRKEDRVAEHVVALAKSWGLEAFRDDVGNVIIRKAATPGMEDRQTVTFQCHLDMVPQKTADSPHDFEKDPIRPRVDGDVVRATQTTLGADDGIGVSTALAVFQATDIPHGPLEALFTVDEESGMTGAKNLKPGLLEGDILLNLDSEDEGEICIGCAGGIDAKAEVKLTETAVPAGSAGVKIVVGGLKGGHSGVDIHLGRGNANKVLTRLLLEATRTVAARLASFQGGNLRNAIPRDATATVVVKKAQAQAFVDAVTRAAAAVRDELRAVDPDLHVEASVVKAPSKALTPSWTGKLLAALQAVPHGAFAMVRGMPHVTETSNNLAIVTIGKGRAVVHCMARSSVESKKDDLARTLASVFDLVGAKVTLSGAYPGWNPDTSSPMLAVLKDVYERRFRTPAKIVATHGGLECGLIRAVYPHMDAVSIGPTIRAPHSPDEHVDIRSVQKFWDFLVDALARVPKKAAEA